MMTPNTENCMNTSNNDDDNGVYSIHNKISVGIHVYINFLSKYLDQINVTKTTENCDDLKVECVSKQIFGCSEHK